MSAGQKAFNALVRDIGQRREVLAGWEAIAGELQTTYVDELVPLRASADQRARELILQLDAHGHHQDLSSSERQFISARLLDLLEKREDIGTDATLKDIFNRHASADFDEELASGMAVVRADFERMFGESLGRDADDISPEELMQRIRERLRTERAREASREQARLERKAARASKRKASKGNKAGAGDTTDGGAPNRREALQAALTQSLREIYRKLASALHPDREPDAERRQHKTALMQSLNQAYEKQDLLHMLELQVQLQQIDQDALNMLDAGRLEHYNRLLKDQVALLDQEIGQAQSHVIHTYGIEPSWQLTPADAMQSLAKQVRALRDEIDALEAGLAQFADIKQLKRWLKEEKKRQKAAAQALDALG